MAIRQDHYEKVRIIDPKNVCYYLQVSLQQTYINSQ